MPTLHILRGLPGTGKTTRAHQLGHPVVSLHDTLPPLVPDLSPAEWKQHKEAALQRCKALLKSGRSVVVDDCHVTLRSIAPYVSLAERYGCEVEIEALHGQPDGELVDAAVKRNTHGTSRTVIEAMAARWEE